MKLASSQLKSNMENFVGLPCILMPEHPNAGKGGKTIRVEMIDNTPAMVVEIKDGENIKEVLVFDNRHILFLV